MKHYCYFIKVTYGTLNEPLLWEVDERTNQATCNQVFVKEKNTPRTIDDLELSQVKGGVGIVLENGYLKIPNFNNFKKAAGFLIRYTESNRQSLPANHLRRSKIVNAPNLGEQVSELLTIENSFTKSKGQSTSHEELPNIIQSIDPTTPPSTPTRSRSRTMSETIVSLISSPLKPKEKPLRLNCVEIANSIKGETTAYLSLFSFTKDRIQQLSTYSFISESTLATLRTAEVMLNFNRARRDMMEIIRYMIDEILDKVIQNSKVDPEQFKIFPTHLLDAINTACNSDLKKMFVNSNFTHDWLTINDHSSNSEIKLLKDSKQHEESFIHVLLRGFNLEDLPIFLKENLKKLGLHEEYNKKYEELVESLKSYRIEFKIYYASAEKLKSETLDLGTFNERSSYVSIESIMEKLFPPLVPEESNRFKFFGRSSSGNNLKKEMDLLNKVKKILANLNGASDNNNHNNFGVLNPDQKIFVKAELAESLKDLIASVFGIGEVAIMVKEIDKHKLVDLATAIEQWQRGRPCSTYST